MSGVTLLVGMGPGMGLALARRFGREDHQIVMMARDAEALDGFAASLKNEDILAHPFAADAADRRALKTVFDAVRTMLGVPDVLIYNAAALHQGHASMISADEVMADFAVNVAGALNAAQLVLPGMRRRGSGTILFTGGGFALEPAPNYASLGIGKAGLRNLTASLAREVAGEGVHVATVTICGRIVDEGHFAAATIAEEYWRLHRQTANQWDTEILYRDAPA